jgi:hypothetical protein
VSDARDRIFEALVDIEREPEFSYEYMALSLRQEAFDRAAKLEATFQLAGPIFSFDGVRTGVIQQVNRGRILGLAHQLFWEARAFESELRAFLARKMVEHHSGN